MRPRYPKQLSGPCLNCPGRSAEPNCHNPSICRKWDEFQRELAEERAAKKEGCEARQYSRSKGRELHERNRKKDR